MSSWKLLERFLESDYFDKDPSLAVSYLARYHRHVGIQYVLCSKLRSFAYEEIEFFLPELCHLLVSVDHESMGLEEFIIDLCQESVSGALLVNWLLQTHLHDLAGDPQSSSFKTCRRVFNKVQQIIFGGDEPLRSEKIHENILPSTVLASIVLASVAAPFLPREFGPLAIAQARKPQPLEDTISETPSVQKLTRSHTVAGTSRGKSKKTQPSNELLDLERSPDLSGATNGILKRKHAQGKHRKAAQKAPISSSPASRPGSSARIGQTDARISTTSLPDFPYHPSRFGALDDQKSRARRPTDDQRRHSYGIEHAVPPHLTEKQKISILRAHYFRCETQFLSALEGISNRLVALPKPARLSALRAELALIARDLPAEVDIPLLCPATLADGVPSRSKHHRIVRLNPAEATSLNSAERVPYLLMIEVLREDFDFDPATPANQRLLSNFILQKDSDKRRLFDITAAERASVEQGNIELPSRQIHDSVFEPANGDLSSPDLLRDLAEHTGVITDPDLSRKTPPRVPSAPRTPSGSLYSTPRMSEFPFGGSGSSSVTRSNAATPKESAPAADGFDIPALATHMRTAAQMLAQLDGSGAKLSRLEVENIKAKIIASMQNLEEQNFSEDSSPTAALDNIMSNGGPSGLTNSPIELQDGLDSNPDTSVENSEKGAARMENDQKTGGVRRKGDRDDPSAATFGEEWNSKKVRIRKSSPYGWMKNWDLLSVIVKTGSDLRQELFACQLIRICAKIWEDAKVPVWVKQMRILVTGESSGLIETITNGVSLHSLKRSLTMSSIAAGTNPRKRFMTLKDHFLKAFGDTETSSYKAGKDAFMRSLAAYSILSYILQLKDRHNGNMLIDNHGHIIHIDFGFMLSNSPGSVGFEAAPFKLTQDYVDVLGGIGSPGFEGFKTLCKQAFQALRKSAENIIMVVELMSKESKMACFTSGGLATTSSLRQRFMLHLSKEEAENFVDNDLVAKSIGSYYTRL